MKRAHVAQSRCPVALLWPVTLMAGVLSSTLVNAQHPDAPGDQASGAVVPSSTNVCAVTGAATCCCSSENKGVSRSVARYKLPDVTLVDTTGQTVLLSDVFSHSQAVVMQFAFTSCSIICPVASATMAKAQQELGEDAAQVRFCTISIDPQYDTPARLAEFAKTLEAAEGWSFLTGDPRNIVAVQKAFSAYVPNKSRHEPLTFLRAAHSDQWIRITGLTSATSLVKEVRGVLSSGRE